MNYFRKAIVSIVFTLIAYTSIAQSKTALVIGIGEYPAESGWNRIHGDNDIDIVCLFLTDNGFPKEGIVTLKNAQATKINIIERLKSITATAGPGDYVYIHFSGHGQQITDTNGDEEPDSKGERWDESWIPHDAQKVYAAGMYEGENHIIDDELNALLRNIRTKIGPAGILTVVADACHSGDSSRGEEDEEDGLIVRGTPDRFEIPSGATAEKSSPLPIQWVEISACKSYQNNYEHKEGNTYYGSLSYSLYSKRREILDRPLDVVNGILSESVSKLSPGIQTAQVDAPDGFSNMIIFGR